MVAIDQPMTTLGRTIYAGYEMPLWHNACKSFDSEMGAGSRFRLIFVEAGTGILRYARYRIIFMAPAVFCLNERETPLLEEGQNIIAQSLYFHPSVINVAFNFENVREQTERSEWHDQVWLRPFVWRDERWTGKWTGSMKLGPVSAVHFSRLLKMTQLELTAQRDNGWPCRSRSFFLELLFLLDRLSTYPGAVETDFLGEMAACEDVKSVLLYLHTLYQKKITVTELTRAFHTNRTTLSRQFRQVTGMPVMAYLARMRVNLAALLLRDTELSISEIIARVGFLDRTHFRRTFRQYTGISPSEYRERFCWMLQ